MIRQRSIAEQPLFIATERDTIWTPIWIHVLPIVVERMTKRAIRIDLICFLAIRAVLAWFAFYKIWRTAKAKKRNSADIGQMKRIHISPKQRGLGHDLTEPSFISLLRLVGCPAWIRTIGGPVKSTCNLTRQLPARTADNTQGHRRRDVL